MIETRCMFCQEKLKPDFDDGDAKVKISHGICEPCLQEHYPDEAEEILLPALTAKNPA